MIPVIWSRRRETNALSDCSCYDIPLDCAQRVHAVRPPMAPPLWPAVNLAMLQKQVSAGAPQPPLVAAAGCCCVSVFQASSPLLSHSLARKTPLANTIYSCRLVVLTHAESKGRLIAISHRSIERHAATVQRDWWSPFSTADNQTCWNRPRTLARRKRRRSVGLHPPSQSTVAQPPHRAQAEPQLERRLL